MREDLLLYTQPRIVVQDPLPSTFTMGVPQSNMPLPILPPDSSGDNGVDTIELIPQSTLMGLPDELLTKIIGFAMTSDQAINLYPGTVEQDLLQMRIKLLAPFAGTSRLLAIAEAEYSEANFIYRTTMRGLYVDEWREAATYDPHTAADHFDRGDGKISVQIVDHDYGRKLWFGHHHSLASVEARAKCVTHLELLMPMEVIGGRLDSDNNLVPGTNRLTGYLIAQLDKAFPELRSLVVRVTTYRIGAQMRTFWGPGRTWSAGERLDLQAQEFWHRIAGIVQSLDRLPTSQIKAKAIVLFQKEARHRHEWRDGVLNNPAFDLGRFTLPDRCDLDGYVWRMMDFPSCQVAL